MADTRTLGTVREFVVDSLRQYHAMLTDATNDALSLTLADYTLITSYTSLENQVKNLITTGGQPNVIETVKVDGTALTVTDKAVNVDLSGKVDKVTGKGLSTNDFTTSYMTKLDGIETGAQVNVIETVKVDGTALTVSNKAVNVDLSAYPTSAEWDSTNHVIKFYHGDTQLPNLNISGADFVKDGMVSNVTIGNGTGDNSTKRCLIITFNTDGPQTPIEVPLDDAFSADNYYTKTNIDTILTSYLTKADAASTYLTKADAASTYLTKADAASTYLTKADAASTYLTKADAASTYITYAYAGATYLTKADAASTYLTKADAATTYLTKADAATTYLTKADAASTYITYAYAAATYLTKADAASTYLTKATAASTYITYAYANATYLTKADAASTYITYAYAAATYVAKETGKGLSTNDYTTAEQTKLSGIETGAQVNVIETISWNGTDVTPSSKKVSLTETQLSKGTTSGSGNVVTEISVNGHEITLTKGITALTASDITGKEDTANKKTDLTTASNISNTYYPTTQAVNSYIGSLDELSSSELNTIFGIVNS